MFKKLLLAFSPFLLSSSLLTADIFVQGNKNFGVSMGASHSYENDYAVLGINASYFIADNLALGAEYRGWFGGNPTINELSIPLTYFIPVNPSTHPYLGGFYRRSFIEAPYNDYDTYGFRAGAAFSMNPHTFMSFGWVEEYYNNRFGGTSSSGYPEFTLGFAF